MELSTSTYSSSSPHNMLPGTHHNWRLWGNVFIHGWLMNSLLRVLRRVHIINTLKGTNLYCLHSHWMCTTICVECAFSQSTSMGWGVKTAWIWITSHEMMWVLYCTDLCMIGCMKKQVIREEITSITFLLHIGKLVYLAAAMPWVTRLSTHCAHT